MDERFITLKTILTIYVQEAYENMKELDSRKQGVINSHATFGPSSVLSSQSLGMFYFMIGRTMVAIDKLDSAFKAYIAILEQNIQAKGIELDDEAQRLKSIWEAHHSRIETSRKALEDRDIQICSATGANEKEILGATALKYTEQTNYILRLNNVLSLYADYVSYLEEKLGVKSGFLADDMASNLLRDIYLGLEKQFEFEIERECPKCQQKIMVSPQSPTLLCPFCGAHMAA
jgi:hypothetical protein